jgi:Calcineurin-like phosphoesterase
MVKLFAVAVALLVACDRHPSPPPPEPEPTPPPPVAKSTACNLPPVALRMAMPKRAVAIGDLHGDLSAARAALRAAGAIDADDHWIGNDLVIIQTGDVLDRGSDESHILELLERLDTEAHAHGGAVIQLLGNHELMNAAGDFRYVTPGGQRDFDGDRAGELGPGGRWAKHLANHNAIAIVGDTVLSHAGVTASWLAKLDQANLEARCWLDGESSTPASLLTSDDSPVWTRAYGNDTVDCAALGQVLQQLGAKRMVVAHTVQKAGINSQCDGALWRIDVGMTAMFGGPIQVLELGDAPKIISGTR